MEMVKRLVKDDILHPLDFIDMEICINCTKGRLTKTKMKDATHSLDLLEIIHTNFSGPYSSIIYGYKYFITFIKTFPILTTFI